MADEENHFALQHIWIRGADEDEMKKGKGRIGINEMRNWESGTVIIMSVVSCFHL